MNDILKSMPSALNLIECKSPFDTTVSAACYQGISNIDEFATFLCERKNDGTLHELTLRESDRYGRLVRVYLSDHSLIHAVINLRTGIVHLVVYTLRTNKISEFEAEYFVYQIRQHINQY
ncbi:hypothetical protein ACT99I_004348 [Salmonella enterica subsp. houtenae serovar [1],40:z4,z23:-]